MKTQELLHPAHTNHLGGKSPIRVPTTTKQTSTDRDKEIEDPRKQIKLLKQNQEEHDTQEQPKHTENKEEHNESKNIQVVSASTVDSIKVSSPKTPKFYISPKIHKPNNPGRPLINLFVCHISEISRFVDRNKFLHI